MEVEGGGIAHSVVKHKNSIQLQRSEHTVPPAYLRHLSHLTVRVWFEWISKWSSFHIQNVVWFSCWFEESVNQKEQ